jgi:RHS repeat-associated protein
MGKSVAEYVLNPATTPDVRTRYLTQDQLGSPRVVTDGTGQVQERHDYLAYGEEAGSSLSTVRTTAQKYAGASAVRKRYTGYERDDESGLDYAQARYYNNAHGRFTSVDPLTASATIKNPQTFNRYSYCLNSPYKFTDPLGLKVQYSGVNDPEVAGMDQDQTHDPNPVATESATLVIPTLHGVIAVTVKVYQINNPDIGISDVKGSQQLNVGVDLVFELTGPDGKPIKGTATEHVERLEGEPINQNESTVPLVQGRGKDLVSNPAGAPPRDAVAERAALDKLNKNFITKQRFNLDVVTDGGAHIRVTQVRTLTNEVRGAPSIARGAIRGYTFTMEKPTISLVPQ